MRKSRAVVGLLGEYVRRIAREEIEAAQKAARRSERGRRRRKLRKRHARMTYSQKSLEGLLPRPHYAYGTYHAARLAKRLGIQRISVIEFGVAGGNGLLALEEHANAVEQASGVAIDVFGFDTGEGLPAPEDYRDMPYRFSRGAYRMDVDALRKRLTRAQLVIGDIKVTGESFLSDFTPSPIGFAAFDMDFYSSTMQALRIFAGQNDQAFFLPRIQMYFDDINGTDISAYNEHVGELAAIATFNSLEAHIKIAENRVFRTHPTVAWGSQMYLMHRFHDDLYSVPVANSKPTSLSLNF